MIPITGVTIFYQISSLLQNFKNILQFLGFWYPAKELASYFGRFVLANFHCCKLKTIKQTI